MNRIILLLLLLPLIMAPRLYAQDSNPITVTGSVKDINGEPLAGVTVLEKGTSNGTRTVTNGSYSLQVKSNATILFSSIGFSSEARQVSSASGQINVQLKEERNILKEVVAIGYQSLRKSDVTGAVSSVKASELNLTAPTVAQALVGKVAGVQVQQVSGAPYASPRIRVRGIGSINASSDPLYVIDGYPAGNDLFIDPNDIASIDILKDAASAAIYGSRAAGGVVIITTKRGREGKGRFEYDVETGIDQLSHKIKLLNADQFAQLVIDGRNNTYRDLVVNSGKPFNQSMWSDNNATRVTKVGNASGVQIPPEIYNFASQTLIKPTVNTDWQDALYHNAFFQRHNVSFSGGNGPTNYYVSGGYQDQPGIIRSTGQQRINFRANIDGSVSKRLKVSANIGYTQNTNQEVQEGRFDHGPILGALIYMPYFPEFNPNGSYSTNVASSQSALYGYQTIENPVALATQTKINRKGARSTYNGSAIYSVLPGLDFKANLGVQTYTEKYDYYLPSTLSAGVFAPGTPQALAAARAVAQTLIQNDQLAEFTLNYAKTWGKHNFNLLAGYTAQKTTSDVINVSAQGFQNDKVPEITAKGADPSNFYLNSSNSGTVNFGTLPTAKSAYTLLSYLGRAVYNYESRYYLTASFRVDGSSRFGPLNKYGTFPSVSAGWTLSDESFYKALAGNSSTVKLRASWGLSGNNNIGNYSFLQTLNSPGGVVFGNNSIATAITPGDIKDPHLGWESTSQYNFGADIGLFNGRLSLIANYYLSYSYNLLFSESISAVSGAWSILTNLPGTKIRNRGFDFQIDSRIISGREVGLGASGNISINRNKVLALGTNNTILVAGAERSYKTHITEVGQPVGMFYGFKVKGIVRASDLPNIAADNAVYNAATQSFPAGYKLKGPPRSASSTNPLQPGDLYFQDTNGDGIVNDADKTVIGSPYPKLTYGFSLTANYNAVDLSAGFNGSYGNQVLDGQDYYLYNMEGSGNQYADVADRYRSEEQPGAGHVYRASRGGDQSNSTRLSSFYLQDGSFLRCTNVTLGYTLKSRDFLTRAGLGFIRLYASVNNAFTITKYKGYNPEVDYDYSVAGSQGTNLTPGVDYGVFPLVRTYNLGLKVSF